MKIPSTNETCDCTCTDLGDCVNPQCGSENCCSSFGDCICDYSCNGVTWIPYSIGLIQLEIPGVLVLVKIEKSQKEKPSVVSIKNIIIFYQNTGIIH